MLCMRCWHLFRSWSLERRNIVFTYSRWSIRMHSITSRRTWIILPWILLSRARSVSKSWICSNSIRNRSAELIRGFRMNALSWFEFCVFFRIKFSSHRSFYFLIRTQALFWNSRFLGASSQARFLFLWRCKLKVVIRIRKTLTKLHFLLNLHNFLKRTPQCGIHPQSFFKILQRRLYVAPPFINQPHKIKPCSSIWNLLSYLLLSLKALIILNIIQQGFLSTD